MEGDNRDTKGKVDRSAMGRNEPKHRPAIDQQEKASDRMNNKSCPKCGAGFRCEGDNDCWCESVQLHKKEMIEIMELYTDCLCPGCLKKFEKE